MTITELDERINNLEVKISYLEDFLNQIQGVCSSQTQDISVLQQQTKKIMQRVREMSELMEGDIPNRKPPHY